MENNDTDILEQITRLTRALRRRPKHGHGTSRGAYRIMAVLEGQDAMRTGDIAESLGIRMASLTEALVRLENHGLVTRERDAEDSRIIRVSLAEKAKDRLAEGRARYQELSEKLNGVLTGDELTQFSAACEKLIAFLEAEIIEEELSEGEWAEGERSEGKRPAGEQPTGEQSAEERAAEERAAGDPEKHRSHCRHHGEEQRGDD